MANWRFNADGSTGHDEVMLLASIGALRVSRFALRHRFTWGLMDNFSVHPHAATGRLRLHGY